MSWGQGRLCSSSNITSSMLYFMLLCAFFVIPCISHSELSFRSIT